MLVRIGSRGSRLALTQAELAGAVVRAAGHEVVYVPITTAGDRDRKSPFGQIGERGVFVKEIEEALLAGRIDVAVHSAKDMTSTDTDGLIVGAYLERDDPRDALVGADALEPGMRIGTASVRRRAQLLALDPTISVEPLRGNIDTRLRKARERGLDALILAACGLDRLGLAGEIGLRLPVETMLPEAAQGALALQVRVGEEELVAGGDSAETRRSRRGRARLCRARRRRLPRPGRRTPRRRAPDGADRGRGRDAGSSGGAATSPRRWPPSCWRRRRSGRHEGDRHPAACPGPAARRADRGSSATRRSNAR